MSHVARNARQLATDRATVIGQFADSSLATGDRRGERGREALAGNSVCPDCRNPFAAFSAVFAARRGDLIEFQTPLDPLIAFRELLKDSLPGPAAHLHTYTHAHASIALAAIIF